MRCIWLTRIVVVVGMGYLAEPCGEQAAGQVAITGPKKGKGSAELGKPILAVDYGGHVDRLCSYAVTADGKKLITLGMDNTLQVWDAATRERLKILRLPLTMGADRKPAGILYPGAFVVAAPDGKTVVIKTKFKAMSNENDGRGGDWYLINLETDRVMRFAGLPKTCDMNLMPVFSPDGDSLAVQGVRPIRLFLLRGFKNVWQPESPGVTVWQEFDWPPGRNHRLEFSADGSKLLACYSFIPNLREVAFPSWDLKNALKASRLVFKTEVPTNATRVGVSFSARGTRLAAVWAAESSRWLEVWTGDGLCLRSKPIAAPPTPFPMWDPFFRGENEVLAVAAAADKHVQAVVRFDIKKGRFDELLRFTPPAYCRSARIAGDGQRLVMLGGKKADLESNEVAVLDLEPNAKLQYLHIVPPAPKLAFSKVGRKLAWTGADDGKLVAGIDLETGEPLPTAELKSDAFSPPASTAGTDGLQATPRFSKGGLIDIWRFGKVFFTVYAAGQDWVLSTPEGYYAATPGGEKMVGWHVNNGLGQAASFYPFERFRKTLFRPDVIALVLEKGSVAQALKVADALRGEDTVDVQLDEQLPPRAVLSIQDQSKLPAVTLKVRAEASSKKQPVTVLRLLVDGRPLPEGAAHKKFDQGVEKAEAEWSVTLPPGKHQLTVLARCPDSSSKSNTVEVAIADPTKQHALHVLAIGVSDYEERTLKLDYAAKDAHDIAGNFAKCCKGDLFSEVNAETLVNAKVRKDAILKQLAELRKQAKPNDLVVVFFAGHGIKEKDKFYLLTVEADPADLAKTALSGQELRKALGEFPCQVLLMLDACHSSGSLKNFRSAVDDLTRNLTDDDCGVAVMCAAMAHEKALEKGGNGLFTKAIVDGLNRGEGVPYNISNHRFYIHHLHGYVFDRVSDQSGGRQHPFLSLPWVVESFPVSQFAVKPVGK